VVPASGFLSATCKLDTAEIFSSERREGVDQIRQHADSNWIVDISTTDWNDASCK